jgi:CubicO group peptidase (beta-lactamase class C family)
MPHYTTTNRYDQRVGDVWPAFTNGGKHDVLIQDAISHRAGMPNVSLRVLLAHLFKDMKRAWDRGIRHIEEYVPEWTPGTRAKYHYVSFSWIIGGILAGVNGGKMIGQIVEQRVANVLQCKDEIYVGARKCMCVCVCIHQRLSEHMHE